MNAIVVVDQNWAIGCEDKLLFSLPTDMKHFRSLTLNGTVILGRRTLDTFPGGKPLPKRRNIVITHQPTFAREGAEIVHSPTEALSLVEDTPTEELWVIGGSSIYTALLNKCKYVYLTKVETKAPQADAFFPNLDKLRSWTVKEESAPMEENGLTFRFVTYENTAI